MKQQVSQSQFKPIALMVGLLAGGGAADIFAHGYVSEPEGRSYLCKLGDNTGCGAVQWEPQSVEGPDGQPRFPVGGPEDGTIAAAGSPSWSELNAQTPSRWYKHDFAAGYQTFEWTFTANHVSRDWRYFITKPGWNPAEPLSRDAFDLIPSVSTTAACRLTMVIQHNCYVPEREGYHVIMAVDVGDTDLVLQRDRRQFAGDNVVTSPSPEPEADPFTEVGLISGAIALESGDVISTLVYDDNGEMPALSVSYEATGYLSGLLLRSSWLATSMMPIWVTTRAIETVTCLCRWRARTGFIPTPTLPMSSCGLIMRPSRNLSMS